MSKAKKNTTNALELAQILDNTSGTIDTLMAQAEEAALAELAAKEERDRLAAEAAALAKANEPEADPDAGQADEDEGHDEPFILNHVAGDLNELKANVTQEAKEQKALEVIDQFETRAAFEARKNPDNDKMQVNLRAYAKRMATLGACGILVATDVDPNFLNRELSTGSRFNVYAIDKVNDLLLALDAGIMKNAINRAVMLSLFKFRAAGVAFTGQMALAAASDKIKVERAMNHHLVRHTVSPGVAPTQASSTMGALQVLGVVNNVGTFKHPVYQLTDTPQTRRLKEALAA